MDEKLIRWARAVKARARHTRRARLPTLWVFSDRERLPDPAPVLRLLPKGVCGLVLRPGSPPDPAIMQRALAVCRARRFPLVMVGGGMALHFGRHVPRATWGTGWVARRGAGLLTASAHSRVELVRAARGTVDCVFLSPVFATLSHPGRGALGVLRWSDLARMVRTPVVALGGITGANVQRLPRRVCAGIAVVGAALGR